MSWLANLINGIGDAMNDVQVGRIERKGAIEIAALKAKAEIEKARIERQRDMREAAQEDQALQDLAARATRAWGQALGLMVYKVTKEFVTAGDVPGFARVVLNLEHDLRRWEKQIPESDILGYLLPPGPVR